MGLWYTQKAPAAGAGSGNRLLDTAGDGMGRLTKVRDSILAGASDSNIDFGALCQLLLNLGFEERCRGSHHIFTRHGVDEIINIQPKGKNAKAYQVRQVRNLLIKYQLGASDVD